MKIPSKLQKLLYTLSDVNRLRIIHCVGDGEVSVGEIVASTDLSQPLVSHHLKALKNNGIVRARRKGPFIYYRLALPELLDVLGILSELAEKSIRETDTQFPMFKCPPWWWNMSSRRK